MTDTVSNGLLPSPGLADDNLLSRFSRFHVYHGTERIFRNSGKAKGPI
jgi:hypothetical protein